MSSSAQERGEKAQAVLILISDLVQYRHGGRNKLEALDLEESFDLQETIDWIRQWSLGIAETMERSKLPIVVGEGRRFAGQGRIESLENARVEIGMRMDMLNRLLDLDAGLLHTVKMEATEIV